MKGLILTFLLLDTICYGFPETNAVNVPQKTIKKPQKTNCCQNNGICILGTFCKCKKHFYGRHCEHRIEFKSCGTIAHGAWFKSECNLCKCFDGQISCIPRIYPGCEYDSPFLDKEATTKDPLMATNIQIISNDRDFQDVKHLDEFNLEDFYYDDVENTSSRAMTNVYVNFMIILIVVFVII